LPTENKPPSPTGVTDEIIELEIQAHWTARAMRPVRRVYEWILHWAETKYGGVALGAISFSEAVFFPIPPDPLLVALCLGKPRRSFWYAINCTVTNVMGGMTALFLGMLVGQERVLAAMAWLGQEENARKVLEFFGAQQGFWHDFLVIGIAALTPIPFKVFAWVAGFAGCDWLAFLLAQTIFRKIRFIAVGWIIFAFGAAARRFIDKYFNWVFMGVMLLLILIVLGIKCLGQLIGG
jgi:membrane protein YqaA with SNARE-associated domain